MSNHNGTSAPTRDRVGVRALRPGDTPALRANCWPTLPQEQAHERVAMAASMARRGRGWPVVGLYDGLPVGFGQLLRWRENVEIADLVVSERFRSRGVGTAIIQRLVALAAESGATRVEVGVAEANARAHALYRRLGFTQPAGRLLLDLGQGAEPVVYLSREIIREPDL